MKNNGNTILKGLLAIAAVIVIITSISRLFLFNSETLAEHIAKNPPASTPKPTSEPTNTPVPEDAYDIEVTPTPAPTEDPAVHVMKEFYYSPLSEEQKEYITGCSYPEKEENLAISYEDLSYVHILHYDFEGNLAEGELICNNYIAQDLLEIFYELYLNEYRLERVTLIENYGGDDTLSMSDNNTSCFNYRVVDGTTNLSKHAYGLAIDINPFYNPYVTYPGGKIRISPPGSEPYADRDADFPYKIDENDLCYKLFKEHGFTWGGDWNSSKDYQHFQKVIK